MHTYVACQRARNISVLYDASRRNEGKEVPDRAFEGRRILCMHLFREFYLVSPYPIKTSYVA